MDGDPARVLARRRRRARLWQRFLVNPPVKLAVRLGWFPGHVLVRTVGRRTGRVRSTVVGARRAGPTVRFVAEHGRHAGYVANLVADPHVRVLLGRRWHRGVATLEPQVDPERLLDSWGDPAHARAVRRVGTELTVVRIDLHEPGEQTDRS